MNTLTKALSNTTYTENNMPAYKSSLNACLDLFYRIGLQKALGILELFLSAFKENPLLAVKIAGWSRSIRNGAGVRKHIREILTSGLFKSHQINWEWFVANGYWKDIFALGVDYFDADDIVPLIAKGIDKKDNLLLKYLPRQKRKKDHPNNQWIKFLRETFELTPKQYRQLCASYITTETQMCANKWNEIKYEHVPSVCMNRNGKHFFKHDTERMKAFVDAAKQNKAKVNTAALYPHQIIIPYINSKYCHTSLSANDKDLMIAQWNNLGNKFSSDKRIFVVADCSGSMVSYRDANNPIAISKALAIYLSERITGAFHNFISIFSDIPAFFQFNDTDNIYDKLQSMKDQHPANTDLEALFSIILHKAITEKVPEYEMPEIIMVISDMQFDASRQKLDHSAYEMIQALYANAGYNVPTVVFWNVRNANGMPVRAGQQGVVLFSGASPNTIKQAISGNIDPVSAMLNVVDKDEYNFLK